jgi:transposase
MRLTREGSNYFIFFPFYPDIKEKISSSEQNIVSIDPGIITFATLYSPQGEWLQVGKNINPKLEKLRDKIKIVEKKFSDNQEKKVKVVSKIRAKISNTIDDFHWKFCHFLLENYDKILIPRLYVQKGKKLKDQQSDLRHCKFVDRLIYKSMFYKNKEVHEVKEHWTSKTCTGCGNIDMDLGSSRIYDCMKCNLSLDRDLNGARNIFLKHL